MTPRDDQGPIYWACRQIDAPGNVDTVRRTFASRPDAAILESVADDPIHGRWSIYAADAVRSLDHRNARPGVNPFDEMASAMRPWRPLAASCPFPFVGGWIGYLSYEAGRWIEPSAGGRHALTPFGTTCWRLYDTVLLHDKLKSEWHVAGIESCHSPSPLEERIVRWCEHPVQLKFPPASNRRITAAAQNSWNLSRTEYLHRVEKIKDYLRAGDIYQANLTRRWKSTLPCDPSILYDRLCKTNPAAYAAFLRFDEDDTNQAVLSSSPELFLKLEDNVVTTRPIKGTRPRVDDQVADEKARAELAASDKERAELNMIIDLERNDLGRVCKYGTVEVISDGEIETHPTVFHRTATIRGELRDDCDAIDLLRATFPGGSITGAPKVRAMQIIDELEPEARGPYCGAVGYISIDGNMQLNLPIRTMMTVGDRLELAVGSGIVIGSQPDAEYEELNAKAAGMMRAVQPVPSKETIHA